MSEPETAVLVEHLRVLAGLGRIVHTDDSYLIAAADRLVEQANQLAEAQKARAEVIAVAAALARLSVPDADDLSDRQQDALIRYARRLAVAVGIE